MLKQKYYLAKSNILPTENIKLQVRNTEFYFNYYINFMRTDDV